MMRASCKGKASGRYASAAAASFMLMLMIMTACCSQAAAKTTVCNQSGCNFSTIQEAVDTALPREVIEVSSGIYVENVFIGKPLTLKGVDTGNGKPIIDAGGYGSAVTLEAGGIVLDGFKLTGSGHCGCGNAGVNVASNNNTVTNNVITGNKYGVHVSDTFGNRFFNNDISENEIAVLDEGNNTWESGSGILGPIASLFGKGSKGNHYGEYDSPAEGCNDTNKDGVCDRPFIIAGGKNVDLRPLVSSP